MKTYIIERNIANLGVHSSDELIGISVKFCDAIEEMGHDHIEWIQSYIAEDKMYCIYKAITKDKIREHARKVGVPANSIMEISSCIDPLYSRQ